MKLLVAGQLVAGRIVWLEVASGGFPALEALQRGLEAEEEVAHD